VSDVDQLMKRLSIRDGVLMLRPDVPGRSATALVRISNKYRLEMLLKKESIIFSFDF